MSFYGLLDAIIVALIFFASFARQGSERYAVIYFVIMVLLFQWFGEWIKSATPDSGALYFLVHAMNDLLIIIGLSQFKKMTEFTMGLQDACIAFIFINVLGWLCYEYRYPIEVYVYLCLAAYLLILKDTLTKGQGDVLGNTRMVNAPIRFFGNHLASRDRAQKIEKETST